MFKFIEFHKNYKYIENFKKLHSKYSKFLTDDFSSKENIFSDIYNKFGKLIFIEFFGEFMGFVYLYDWIYNKDEYFSVTITAAIEKKFWGRRVELCAQEFFSLLHQKYKFYQILAEVYENNKRVLGILKKLNFSLLYTKKNATKVGGILTSINIFAFKN